MLNYGVNLTLALLFFMNSSCVPTLWKGVLCSGKTGLFNPSNTVAYLGLNLPSNRNSEFTRNGNLVVQT